MSLFSPYESAPYSYDVFSSGAQELAAGTVYISLYVPKFIPSIPTTAVNQYQLDVIDIGEISVNFDVQNEAGDITDFKFNVPSFKMKVRDIVVLTQQSVMDTVTNLSEALSDVPSGFLSVIEFTYNSTKTYFYVRKSDFSLDVTERTIELEGAHPLAMNAVPFGKDPFYDGSYSSSELKSFAGYFGQQSTGITYFPGGDLYTNPSVATPFYASVTFETITAWNFIGTVLRYLQEDAGGNIELDSLVFSDSVRTVDFGGDVGSKNCLVLMAGEIYALPKSDTEIQTENTIENLVNYGSEPDWYITTLPSTDSLASGVDNDVRRVGNDGMKAMFVKLARMDGAFFGSILGESFYISRAKKNTSYKVILSEDDFLSLEIAKKNIDPSVLSFRYPVSRSKISSGAFTTNMIYNETINREGTTRIDIDFEPASYFSFYEQEDRAELGQNMMIAKLALVNDGPDTDADYLLAPIYYDSSATQYDTSLGMEATYYAQYSQDVATAYKNALGGGTGISISGEIQGIDTLKAYEYINISSTHPAINGKDFRISSISYNLKEDKISFEAYEF
jgi:hypothetical protein